MLRGQCFDVHVFQFLFTYCNVRIVSQVIIICHVNTIIVVVDRIGDEV